MSFGFKISFFVSSTPIPYKGIMLACQPCSFIDQIYYLNTQNKNLQKTNALEI